jgi:hypothetical protein
MGGKVRLKRKADNLTAICEPIVYKIWDSRRLKTLWTSTAYYRDSSAFFYIQSFECPYTHIHFITANLSSEII